MAATPAVPDWLDEFTPDRTYLNTASMGLPPRRAVAAVARLTDAWATGNLDMAVYGANMDTARASYARIAGLPEATVFLGSQTSALVGLIAASLPTGTEVLVTDGDYASLTLPFLARPHDLTVRTAPLDRLAEQVGPGTGLVAVSTAQSATGAVVDLAALRSATRAVGAEILLDTTQSAGWWTDPLADIGYTCCSAYKWLMAPRGTAFGSVRADLVDAVVPFSASVDGQAEPGQFYPGGHRPADTARRFDVSPAWPAWAGAVESMALVERIGVTRVHEHSTGLATRCAEALGVTPTGSPILAVAVTEATADALAAAGIRAAFRAGRLRLAFHLHNTDADVERVATVVAPHMITRS